VSDNDACISVKLPNNLHTARRSSFLKPQYYQFSYIRAHPLFLHLSIFVNNYEQII